jgi:drug/metabolite transporter (DMT)-like permease
MTLSETGKGELFIFFEIIIWSFFPILTILSYNSLSPFFTYAFISLLSGLTFAILLGIRHKWHEIMIKEAFKDILLSSIFISFFYGLFFIGLKYTSAGNASILALMEVFFSFLIFRIWGDEKHRLLHTLGSLIMLIGAVLILFKGDISLNKGGVLIIIATVFSPLANLFTQKARKKIGSEAILFLRTAFTTVIFFFLALSLDIHPTLTEVKTALPWLLISSVLLFSISKILWIEGIHRISVIKAISLSNISPVFTLLFAYLILHEIPTLWQIIGFIPILIGAFLILKK